MGHRRPGDFVDAFGLFETLTCGGCFMTGQLLLVMTMLAGGDGEDPAPKSADPPSDRAAYEAARAGAGSDAAAQVRLALWCEAHGLMAERLRHLSLAILYQPSNPLARGLLGLVRYRQQWARPEAVVDQVRDDASQRALVDEYLERRAKTPSNPQAQMKLADWCAEKRLKEQAMAHYGEVVRLDPSRDAAWRKLGYRKQGVRGVKTDEIAATKQDAIRQKQADKHWRPKLLKLREDLQSKDTSKRERTEQALGQVADPRALPSIWSVFVTGGVRHQLAAIQMFGQIDGPSASHALAALAVFSPVPEVRGRAIETLTRRDPRDVAARLIDLVHRPFKYEVRPVGGPGSPGEIYVEGERFNIQRLYQNQTTSLLLATGAGRLFTPDVPFDPFSIQNMMMAMGAWTNNPVTLTPKGLVPSSTNPIDPQAANQAARAIAANPQNAPGILNQLINDPNNRVVVLPPGYTVPLNNPAYSIPVRLVPMGPMSSQPNGITGPPTGAMLQGMERFAAQVQAQQHNPLSPMGMAISLGKIQQHTAHQQSAQALSMVAQGQQMAAQRDYELGLELERIRQSNLNLQQRLAMDVQFIEWMNQNIRQIDDRVLPVLKAITGLDLGIDREKWRAWWFDQLDYAPGRSPAAPRVNPTYREYATDSTGTYNPNAFAPAPERAPTVTDGATGGIPDAPVRACFADGTTVETLDGPRRLESLELGDMVLCQDIATGTLEYQPVLAVHRNKPAPALKITAGGETIVATGLRRFWKGGWGWTMARDLKVGDRLRVLGDTVPIAAIEEDRSQPVYNVDVAGNANLFVGIKRFLVHDFGFVPAVAEPFDRRPELPAPAAPARPEPAPARTRGDAPRPRSAGSTD
jgi:hypothetical protein